MADMDKRVETQHARVDSAHRQRTARGTPEPDVAESRALVAASQITEEAREQLERQASQLAHHLRAQKHELDRRQAELNARLSQHELAVRNSRLWHRDREYELSEREAEVAQLRQEFDTRLAAIAAEEIALDDRHSVLDSQSRQQLAKWEKKETSLRQAQQTLAQEVEILRGQKQQFEDRCKQAEIERRCQTQILHAQQLELWNREKKLLSNLEIHRDELERKATTREQMLVETARNQIQLQLETLQARQNELIRAESNLEEEARDFAEQRQNFTNWERETKLAADSSQRQLEEAHRHLLQEKEQESVRFAERRDWLDKREAAVRQMKDEVQQVCQETVEIRLSLEHVWAELCEKAPPAVLTQTMAVVRKRVVDQFRLAESDLQIRKDEMAKLAAQLHERGQQLRDQRGSLQDWADRRTREIEEQAARLVAREIELDREQERCRLVQHEWAEERLRLKSEIRHLLARERNEPVAEAG